MRQFGRPTGSKAIVQHFMRCILNIIFTCMWRDAALAKKILLLCKLHRCATWPCDVLSLLASVQNNEYSDVLYNYICQFNRIVELPLVELWAERTFTSLSSSSTFDMGYLCICIFKFCV